MPTFSAVAATPNAAVLAGGAYLEAPSIGAYELGRGDFTVEAWVRTATAGGSGTVLARKGTPGGPRDGGFLLVVRSDGTIKLATDNGFGFSELDTVATSVNDGAWHHLAAVRQGARFAVYLDGLAVSGTTRGSLTGPLDVSNGLPLTIGTTQQTQEPYRAFSGQLGVVRLWSVARSAAQVVGDMRSALAGDPAVIGCWTFDQRDGTDSSRYANTALARGTVTYATPGAPLAGSDVAVRLGASGTYTAPNSAAYQLGIDPFTVEAWVRTAQRGGAGTILARKQTDGGTNGAGFLLVLRPDGTIKLATDNGFAYFEGITVATSVNDARWHHVAAVRQGAGIQIYLDGLAIDTRLSGPGPPPLQVDSSRPLTIGTTEQQGEQYKHLDGELAAVALWRGARSAAQILADMHALLGGEEAGLVGYWSFGYRNGVDLSPTRNPALAGGSVSWVAPGAPIGWYAAAVAQQSYLQAPSNAAYQLGLGDFTLELWARTDTPGGTGTLIARKDAPGGQGDGGFLFVLAPDGRLKLATDSGTGYFQTLTGPTPAADGRWHFLAAVRSQRQLTIYLDGAALAGQTSGNSEPPLSIDSGQPLTIGTTLQTQEPYRFFTGQLDGACLWSGARSAATIAADIGVRPSGREAGLLGYWSFDFRDARDSSPVRNDAAAVGNVQFPAPGAPIGDVIASAPTLTHVDYDGAGALDAQWTVVAPPPLVSGYRLTAFDAREQPIATIEVPTTQARLTVPLAAGPASVRVCALGVLGPGPWSTAVGIVATAPTALALATDTAIAASWAVATGAGAYLLELDDGSTSVESKIVSSTSGELAIPTDRAPAYTCRVRGLAQADAVSTGPWSTPVNVLLSAPALTAVGYDTTNVTLAWTPSLDGYLAAIFEGPTRIAFVGGSGTQATLPVALRVDGGYAARVRARGANTEGPWSAPVIVLSAAPASLLAGSVDGQVAATWHAVTGAPGYEAALAIDGTWGAPQAAPGTTFMFPGAILAGSDYAVRVRALAGISSGPLSAGVPGPFLRAGTFAYDGFGRLLSSELPAIASTTYAYDASGNVTSVVVGAAEPSQGTK